MSVIFLIHCMSVSKCNFFPADIYVSCVSFAHNVASQGHYIAMVSTTVETLNPEEDLRYGLQVLGPILEK